MQEQDNILAFTIYISLKELGFLNGENTNLMWHQCNAIKPFYNDWIKNPKNHKLEFRKNVKAFCVDYTKNSRTIDLY